MKVVLLIVFNHKFERNLGRLRDIYKGRFDHVYFIMPFYTGNEKDVISVYENSFYFNGYLTQSLPRIDGIFDHYLVIGDDLILNPIINQENYQELFKLDKDTAFIPAPFLLHEDLKLRTHMKVTPYWEWNHSAINFNIKSKGLEVENELPSPEEAASKLASHGFTFYPYLEKRQLNQGKIRLERLRTFWDIKHYIKQTARWGYDELRFSLRKKRTISYPMVGSYSDIVIIPGKSLSTFSHYSGIFAALHLFVEIAIPTALMLACDKIVQEKNLDYKGWTLWEDYERIEMEDKYNRSLSCLFSNFPATKLYIHPVKLSKWG